MLDRNTLIKEINKTIQILFKESTFYFQQSRNSTNKFIATGNSISSAINKKKNDKEQVSVIEWFADFWVYSEITFIGVNTFISISIFQGNENDKTKHQLFRAEWDDYNDLGQSHSQPHWHITSNQVIENTFEKIANMGSESDFVVSLVKEETAKIIDVSKMHFAMNGNWMNSETHIHSINSEVKIVKWFQGLLAHIKAELVSVK